VRAALEKVEGLDKLELQLNPPLARFQFDPSKLTLQDLVGAVKKAGSKYDARLLIRTSGDEDAVTKSLGSVAGLRSAGIPDRDGTRLVSFEPEGKTYLADLVKAVEKAGGKLVDPEPKKK
jgi:copper chaperone CopZ